MYVFPCKYIYIYVYIYLFIYLFILFIYLFIYLYHILLYLTCSLFSGDIAHPKTAQRLVGCFRMVAPPIQDGALQKSIESRGQGRVGAPNVRVLMLFLAFSLGIFGDEKNP